MTSRRSAAPTSPADAQRFGSGSGLVADTSAWVRKDSLEVAPRWLATLKSDLVAACPVVSLELGAGARDEASFLALDDALAGLTQAPVTRAACDSALRIARDLGARRRIPAADYLIAAAAAELGFGVLHYDGHFDTLCDALGTESVWVAPSGSID